MQNVLEVFESTWGNQFPGDPQVSARFKKEPFGDGWLYADLTTRAAYVMFNAGLSYGAKLIASAFKDDD
jgi:hypothetical protein